MKKVILFSAIALAAAVSCTKSEVVDTKFNEQIGFETYLGRDAQTKAAVVTTDDLTQVFVYGYYTGTEKWSAESQANLWSPMTLACDKGACTVAKEDVRYWANDSDLYTFLAYAPATVENVLTVAAENGKNPTLTYNVPSTLTDQKDVLYAVPQKDRTKGENGTVALEMKHALARLTVKAKVNAETPFAYNVKSVAISGNFNTTGTLVLAEQADAAVWTATPAAATYTFYTNNAAATDEAATPLTTAGVDYAGTDNYLMMIPTDFSAEGAEAAKLTVVYSTYAGGIESRDYTKEFEVATEFEAGKAYAISLEFIQAENNEIKFSVNVTDWGTETTTTISPAN